MRDIKFRQWDGISGKIRINLWNNLWNPKDYPLMQYTGLKDKNGVEAFDGDICVNENGRIAKIIWFESGACFDFIALNEVGDNYGYSAQMFKYKIAIIGNVHENPELLESEK